MDKVKILMGMKDGARHLDQQLRSISWQRDVDWQLIVSDDGSKDKSRQIIDDFAKGYPGRVSIISGPGQGLAANFLKLLEASPADCYTALSDQDDIWLPGKLSRAIGLLSKTPANRPAIYASSHYVLMPGGRIQSISGQYYRPSFGNALVQNILAGHSIVLSPSAIRLVRAWQPNAMPPFHDWWLYAFLTGIGANVIYDPSPQLLYRQHSDAALGANCGLKARLRRVEMLRNGTYRRWLHDHHAALRSVASVLRAENRMILQESHRKHGSGLCSSAFLSGHVHRQTSPGSMAMGFATAAGLL
ncbi:MAG: glycosyltransferase [Pseudomonadota bacterium]